MRIQCPNCQAGLKISDAKMPAMGTKVRCPKCKNGFVFKKQTEKSTKTDEKSGPVEKKKAPSPGKKSPPKQKSPNEKPVTEASEENEEPLFVKCPQCATPIVCDVTVCPTCGLTLKKENFSLRERLDKARSQISVETVKDGALAYLYKKIVKSAKTYAIVIALILIVSIFGGRLPIISVLFEEDREIMYEGAYGNCQYVGLRGSELEGVIFNLKIGNTGKKTISGVEVDVSDIPYRFQQMYYMCQNLSGVDARKSDPTVSIACSQEEIIQAQEFKKGATWQGVSDVFSAWFLEDFRRDGELFPRDVAFRDWCPEDPDRETGFEKKWRIDNLEPGALVQIGFITYAYKGDIAWDAFSKIKVGVTADAEVVNADPQSSAFVRLFKSVLN